MKKIILLITLLITYSCSSQKETLIEMSNKLEVNYLFANVITDGILKKSLYNDALFVNVFEISDSKATPENLFEGTDEVLSSFLISIKPDDSYYTTSKLYKIEGLVNPKILEIKETKYPEFEIKIEHGFLDKRESKIYKLKGA